ncbi:hypothetical protein DB032_23390 [Chromobacterium sp. Panama]|uniref:efflux RND transporter periplasmic adaptor subunit n=1 Tax=Chromobacterium sp. Panama TaxID=2161826 RepID=UPI000D32513C|nr:HlyD family efflux transporter periplasmic adaptor subunit [Chromobacterium sp. Panama]PTU63378.1 hypothetical protein DB032_23390 [Chromobacterium sp. Panama]
MLKKLFKSQLLASMVLGLVGCLGEEKTTTRIDKAANWQAVARGWVEADGQPRKLSALRNGMVSEVLAQEGQAIAKGQVLFKQDALVAESQVRQDESMLHEHKLAVQAARLDLAIATREARRLGPLAADNTVMKREYDLARDAKQQAKLKLQMAEAGYNHGIQMLRSTQAELKQFVLESPVDGVLARLLVHPGEYVSAGDPVLELAPSGPRVVRAQLDESFLGKVKFGQMVEVLPESRKDAAPLAGMVLRIGQVVGPGLPSDEAGARQDMRVVDCVIALDADAPLLLGQRVMVRFLGGKA